MLRGSVVLIVSGVLVSACGGQKPTETTVAPQEQAAQPAPAATSSWEPPPLPTDTPAIKNLGITGPDKPWESMSYDEKEWYMVGKVHPVMREVFQTLDHEKYAGEKFECVPCHDDDPARKYKMPNPKLSAVPAPGSDDWKAMENAKIVKFMVQRVNPTTAKLLGQELYDPATGKGFSCWGCHPKE